MRSIHLIYSSSTGHTEYVVDAVEQMLAAAGATVTRQRVEQAQPEDLARGDVLLLASGTWNTGGVEGQLHPHMFEFLRKRAAGVELNGKLVALVALGDDRYFYTARASEHLRAFAKTHGGEIACDPLTVINDPYGQEERVQRWCEKKLLPVLSVTP